MLSAGAAWVIQDILRGIPAPEGSVNATGVAWKTGTSYGFRDAWAVGVNDAYTVGVWTGRPDGTPLPGSFGAAAAGPILFDVFRALPKRGGVNTRRRPPEVTQTDICWPLGESAARTAPEQCHVRQQAWILDERIPPTLPNLQQYSWSAGLQTYWVNPLTGLRVTAECNAPQRVSRQVAQWPLALRPWLSNTLLEKIRLPGFDASCPPGSQYQDGAQLAIRHLDDSTRLYLPKVAEAQKIKGVTVDLLAEGGVGQYFWLVNGEPAGVGASQQGLRYTFARAGDYDLTVFDTAGAVDKVAIRVISQP
jgi:penicillin-binding protein 1C